MKELQESFDYDPERKVWVPGRRTFIFMLGGALAGTLLPGRGVEEVVEDFGKLVGEAYQQLVAGNPDIYAAPTPRGLAPLRKNMTIYFPEHFRVDCGKNVITDINLEERTITVRSPTQTS